MESVKKKIGDMLEGKKYIDFITAAMSVPIVFTVLITNVSNYTNKDTKAAQREEKPLPTQVVTEVVKIIPVEKDSPDTIDLSITPTLLPTQTTSITPSPTQSVSAPVTSCTKKVGPVEVTSPAENAVIEEEPVCIDIAHNGQEYCSVVWSYRLNGSEWSPFTDKAICLYSMPSGEKHIEIRVKSIASADEVILERNFTYNAQENSPTPTIPTTQTVVSSTSSATLTITPTITQPAH